MLSKFKPEFPGLSPVDPKWNIRSVNMHGGVLCLVCRTCGHRGSVESSELPCGLHGDMATLAPMTFRCASCGSYLVEKFLPADRRTAKEFVAGSPKRKTGPTIP